MMRVRTLMLMIIFLSLFHDAFAFLATIVYADYFAADATPFSRRRFSFAMPPTPLLMPLLSFLLAPRAPLSLFCFHG